MRRQWIMTAMVFGLCGFSAVACGPQQKPAELLQLEALRAGEDSAEINQAAPEAYRRCTELTEKSVSAWQDGELATSKTYASLGQRQYATAQAEARRQTALSRIKTAESEQKTIRLKMETLTEKRSGLEKSIALMKANIANADNANAEYRLQVAMTEQERAKGIEADMTEASRTVYGEASKKLKSAGEANAYGRREEASRLADEAAQLFGQAYALAKPEYDRKQAEAASVEKQKALFEDAKNIVGPTYALTDMKSTRMILASAFDKDKYEIRSEKQEALRRIADLAKKYPEASISIEGHVQKSTKQYFEVSQRRADAVRDFLIGQGVDYKRLMTTAKGRENLRYDEKKKTDRTLNDRVEILISLP